MTKVIAFYLPQFHPIPENDLWWGKGFTEWTNVKKAKPLFSQHNQPRVPFNDNYYLLNNKSALQWQSDLMNTYGVDGLCFYHYWFNGKQLLQTPLEILLSNKEINMPFCLSWANEPWTRAWDGGDKEVLMPQSYGSESEWRQHFEYLVRAFKDPRYICFDNKPVFVIYRAASIPNIKNMLSCWRKLAIEHGLSGIHFVMMNTIFKDSFGANGFDASVDFEPMYTIGHHLSGIERYKRSLSIRCRRLMSQYLAGYSQPEDQISYKKIWRKILKRPLRQNNYAGAFVDWDNTPRKDERGLVMHGANPEVFLRFFNQQYTRCRQNNVPFVFINAWNEWAEGTYLEPDSKHGYDYLRAVKKAKES